MIKKVIKSGGHRARFNVTMLKNTAGAKRRDFFVCGRAAESAHQMHFLRLLREDWGEFQNGIYANMILHVCGSGKKALKNPFLQK